MDTDRVAELVAYIHKLTTSLNNMAEQIQLNAKIREVHVCQRCNEHIATRTVPTETGAVICEKTYLCVSCFDTWLVENRFMYELTAENSLRKRLICENCDVHQKDDNSVDIHEDPVLLEQGKYKTVVLCAQCLKARTEDI